MIVTNLINKKIVEGKRRMFFKVHSQNYIPESVFTFQLKFLFFSIYYGKIELKELDGNRYFYVDVPVRTFKFCSQIVWQLGAQRFFCEAKCIFW
jgi:siroheme synthase (precorrin-2 oxidase/ferrochelatase)